MVYFFSNLALTSHAGITATRFFSQYCWLAENSSSFHLAWEIARWPKDGITYLKHLPFLVIIFHLFFLSSQVDLAMIPVTSPTSHHFSEVIHPECKPFPSISPIPLSLKIFCVRVHACSSDKQESWLRMENFCHSLWSPKRSP